MCLIDIPEHEPERENKGTNIIPNKLLKLIR